jgi:hypothetical protein
MRTGGLADDVTLATFPSRFWSGAVAPRIKPRLPEGAGKGDRDRGLLQAKRTIGLQRPLNNRQGKKVKFRMPKQTKFYFSFENNKRTRNETK